MRLQSLRFPVQHPDDFGKALRAAARSLVEAVVVFEDIWLTKHRNEIATLAATNALPVVSLYRDLPRQAVSLPMALALLPSIADGILCRSHSEGSKTAGSPSGTADKV